MDYGSPCSIPDHGFIYRAAIANRAGAKDAAERERKLASWQAGLDQREVAAEDLKERSRELEESERQVRHAEFL